MLAIRSMPPWALDRSTSVDSSRARRMLSSRPAWYSRASNAAEPLRMSLAKLFERLRRSNSAGGMKAINSSGQCSPFKCAARQFT
ncbi:hypothetical protein D9M71_809270 [compost metagenome]